MRGFEFYTATWGPTQVVRGYEGSLESTVVFLPGFREKAVEIAGRELDARWVTEQIWRSYV